MSFTECIARHVAESGLDADLARGAADLFDDLVDEMRQSMGRAAAEAAAERRAMEILQRQVAEKKRRTLLQIRTWQQIRRDVATYRNAKGQPDKAQAVLALLDQDDFAPYSNVEARRKAIRGLAHDRMTEVLATFRRNLIGKTRDPAQLQNVVREIFGQDTGDAAAKQLGRAWAETSEMLRQRFNAAGGSIPKRRDWGLPQLHDTLKVRQVSFESWRDFILPRLDVGRMLDETTGQPILRNRLDLALRDAFEKIRTDGMVAMRPSGVAQGKSMARRHADHRFLVFRDPDSWMQYMDRFGRSNAFDAMLAHVDTMARDIAALEVLGPNPPATLTMLKQTVEREAAMVDGQTGGQRTMDRARSRMRLADDVWAYYTGKTNAPIDGMWAAGFAGLRQTLVAAKLGAASISAITDFNFTRIAGKMVGLSTSRTMRDYLKLMRPGNMEDRKLAVRLGLIADGWSQIASAQARYVGEVSGPEITQRLSDFVMNVSLLSPHTQAGRWAFGMEFAGLLADSQARSFGDLPAPLLNTMRKYGIDAGDWSFMQRVPAYEHEGARFLRASDVEAFGDSATDRAGARRTATKLLEMIQTETEFAIPSASLRGRAAFIGDSRPGTFQGELLRSTLMFKNFAITFLTLQRQRLASLGGPKQRGIYLADLLISTTVMGGMALQLKELSKGRDPRPADTAEFWGAAFLQGGGLGIFGDFLFSDVNRFGGGLAQTMAGPVVQFADDLRRLTLGNALQLPGDTDTNFGAELIRFVRNNTPGASIFYARLGLERLVLDRLQLQIDPKAQARFRQTERRVQREQGQRYFWRPGRLDPRAPDLSNITGD